MVIGAAGVRALLPHRYPMLLVDRVLEAVPGERLTAIKAVTCNEPWYAALGERASEADLAYPETLLIESWGQAAGILSTLARPNPDVRTGEVMLFGSMSDVDILGSVRPGDVVEHRVLLSRELSDSMIFEGESVVDGRQVLAACRMVMAFRPAEGLPSAG